jgi:Nodulin-like
MAAIGANSKNFSESSQGVVVGLQLLFYGLSGTIFSQIFYFLFSSASPGGESYGGFLLMIALVTLAINVLGIAFIQKVHHHIHAKVNPVEDPAEQSLKENSTSGYGSSTIGEVFRSSTVEPRLIGNLKSGKSKVYVHESNSTFDPDVENIILPDAVVIRPLSADKQREDLAGENTKTAKSFTVIDVFKAPSFWLFLFIIMFGQGITYMSNIASIVISLDATASADTIAQNNALQITLISISQSVGRFGFGLLSDLAVKMKAQRSSLNILANIIITVPVIVLSLGSTVQMTPSILSVCSCFVGLGFGGLGSMFPILTREFFGTVTLNTGMDIYGTACSMIMSPVPIGIFASNLVFASYYDSAIASQASNGGDGINCYGSACYVNAFQVILGIQLVPLILSCVLFSIRRKIKLS